MAYGAARKRADPSLVVPQETPSAKSGVTKKRIADWSSRVRAATPDNHPINGLTQAIRSIVDPVGGVDLDLPARAYHREIRFDDWGEPDS